LNFVYCILKCESQVLPLLVSLLPPILKKKTLEPIWKNTLFFTLQFSLRMVGWKKEKKETDSDLLPDNL